MELVTVFLSFNPAEAQLVRSRLDAAGFHANVANEASSLTLAGYSLSAGGVRVQVPESEADEARALLASDREST